MRTSRQRQRERWYVADALRRAFPATSTPYLAASDIDALATGRMSYRDFRVARTYWSGRALFSQREAVKLAFHRESNWVAGRLWIYLRRLPGFDAHEDAAFFDCQTAAPPRLATSPTCQRLVEEIEAEWDFELLPMLHDAAIDAGNDPAALAHCLAARHGRGCSILEALR